MRLLADENVPVPSIRLLRAAGHDVQAVIERSSGIADSDVLALARGEGRVLVTFDRDFGERVYRHGRPVPPGIVYLRVSPADPESAGRVLLGLLGMAPVELRGRFTVVDSERIRQRPLPDVS